MKENYETELNAQYSTVDSIKWACLMRLALSEDEQIAKIQREIYATSKTMPTFNNLQAVNWAHSLATEIKQ